MFHQQWLAQDASDLCVWATQPSWARRLLVNGCLLAAGCCSMQMQFLHERRKFPSVPTSDPTEACPLSVFRAGPTRTARAISRRRFAYQNGVEFRQRLWIGPTTVYSKRKSYRGWHSEAYCYFHLGCTMFRRNVVGL